MSNAKIVLDTCIVSYLMKGGPLAEVYAPYVQGRLLASPSSPSVKCTSARRTKTGAQ